MTGVPQGSVNEVNSVARDDAETSDINQRCLKLAIEGERSCRNQEHEKGIQYLESALREGTDDPRTLSAIYSQLGNAYFYTGDYMKAMEFHRHDLQLAKLIQDPLGEAKACGNLGNTYKVLGMYEEAVFCCLRHLDLSRNLTDKVSESRALYNLGNVYHAKGKYLGRLSATTATTIIHHSALNASLSSCSSQNTADEVRQSLLKAVDYFKQNLEIVEQLQDRAAMGRAWGNLGNTLYLLADFDQAVHFHNKRLELAKEFGDKQAMRRAYSNLANAFVFLGNFVMAIKYYRLAMQLAVELRERATEAQLCYSLGNTFTLMQDYNQAIKYHEQHLCIARELGDKVGEARASWSLGNVHFALQHYPRSLYFSLLHYNLSNDIGDEHGERMATENLQRIRERFEGARSSGTEGDDENACTCDQVLTPDNSTDPQPVDIYELALPASLINSDKPKWLWRDKQDLMLDVTKQGSVRRASMDKLNVIGIESGAESSQRQSVRSVSFVDVSEKSSEKATTSKSIMELPNEGGILRPPKQRGLAADDDFFELLSRAQSKRINDQRADVSMIATDNKENRVRSVDIIKATHQHASVSTLPDQPVRKLTRTQRLTRRWSIIGTEPLMHKLNNEPDSSTLTCNNNNNNTTNCTNISSTTSSTNNFMRHINPFHGRRRSALTALKLPKQKSWSLRSGIKCHQPIDEYEQLLLSSDQSPSTTANTVIDRQQPQRQSIVSMRQFRPTGTSTPSMARKKLINNLMPDTSACAVEFVDTTDDSQLGLIDRQSTSYPCFGRYRIPTPACDGFDTIDSSALTPEQFMELVVGMQARRMDDQRAFLPGLHNPELVMASNRDDGLMWDNHSAAGNQPDSGSVASSRVSSGSSRSAKPMLTKKMSDPATSGSNRLSAADMDQPSTSQPVSRVNSHKNKKKVQPDRDEDFFEMLMRCQDTRIDDQRAELRQPNSGTKSKAVTVPDDDFFQELMAAQNTRYDDQRTPLNGKIDQSKC